MTLETAKVSQISAASPHNLVSQSCQRNKLLISSFISFKPLTSSRPPPPPPRLKCIMLKLRSLAVVPNQADSLPSTSWSFPINPEVHRPNEVEYGKQTLVAEESENTQQLTLLTNANRPTLPSNERNPKRLSSSASPKVVLDNSRIIKYPLITDLAMKEMIENNTLTFIVDKRADKQNIKAAVNRMFKIESRKINTTVMPDGNKKAYAMLKPNHSALEIAKKIRII